MLLTQDLKEFLNLLNAKKVKYIIVGGWAFNFHALPRYTGDFDLFVELSDQNDLAIRQVLIDFRFKSALPKKNLKLLKPSGIIMLGEPPNRIDLLTEIDGVKFEDAWKNCVVESIEKIPVRFLSLDLLIKNKSKANRPKDRADVILLKKIKRARAISSF